MKTSQEYRLPINMQLWESATKELLSLFSNKMEKQHQNLDQLNNVLYSLNLNLKRSDDTNVVFSETAWDVLQNIEKGLDDNQKLQCPMFMKCFFSIKTVMDKDVKEQSPITRSDKFQITRKVKSGITTDFLPELENDIINRLNYKDLKSWRKTSSFFFCDPQLKELQKQKFPIVLTGSSSNVILKIDGVFFACGNNTSNKLMINNHNEAKSFIPIQNKEFQNAGGLKKIAIGINHTLMLCNNGDLLVFGDNNRLMNTPGSNTAPINLKNHKIFRNAGGVKDMETGFFHTFVLCKNGQLYTSGQNNFGQLGVKSNNDQNDFVLVTNTALSHASAIKRIIVGLFHSLILCEDDTIFTCGNNDCGQLGQGNNDQKYMEFTPINFKLPQAAGSIKKVGIGSSHNVLLYENGHLYTCGRNDVGQLGSGNNENQNCFVLVNNPILSKAGGVIDIAVGARHTVLLCKNGDLFACGQNKSGNLGIGNNDNQNCFVQINSNLLQDAGGVKQMIAGISYTMVLTKNNALFFCGNISGQTEKNNACNEFTLHTESVIGLFQNLTETDLKDESERSLFI